MRPAAPHHPDVAGSGAERAAHCGDVELRVVGEDAHRIARPQLIATPVEQRGRPRHHDLVGCGKPAPRGEHLTCIAHDHPVAEHLGDPRETGGEVDRPEDPHLRRGRPALDEHRHRLGVLEVLRRRLALRAVVADPGPPGFELGQRITPDDAIELRVAERPLRCRIGGDEQLHAGYRTVDHGGEGSGLLGAQSRPQFVVQVHPITSPALR